MDQGPTAQTSQRPPEPTPALLGGTIIVTSTRFGDLQIEADKIITMVSPFLGFPESRRFSLLPHNENSPLMWLQSLDDPDLAFVVTSPAAIIPDYNPQLFDMVQDELELTDAQDLDLLVLLTIPHDHPEKMTANLLGPLAINVTKRLAKQVPLNPAEYDSRWPIANKNKEATEK